MTRLDDRSLAAESQATQVLFEEARRRRRRRWTVGVLALAVSLTTVAVAMVARAPSAPRPTAQKTGALSQQPHSAMPTEVVVWSNFGRIEVISSATGHVIRTLATDVALNRGTPQPTVSPSGTVYFDDAHDVNINVPDEQILSVPLSGGPVTVVADGHDPVVSPNGRLLAYLTYADYSSNGREGIVVRDLLTGETKTWQYSNTGPSVSAPSWSPDSESLSFTAVTASPNKRSETLGAWVLRVSTPSGSLDAARKIPLPTGMAWAGYLNPAEGIGVSQHWGPTRRSSTFALSVVDVATGRVMTRLPAVPGQLGVGNIYDGAEGTVQVDPSGQHVAVVEVGSGNGTLYRWTIGRDPIRISADPIQIATGVISAAWVPTH